VHLSGVPQLVSDQEQLYNIVIALSEQHEAANPSPWIPDFPPDMLSAIVGFTMKVDTIEGKYKLSQNRPATDKIQVIRELRAPFGQAADENQSRIAAMMEAVDNNIL
jgi:transcriptional regulator